MYRNSGRILLHLLISLFWVTRAQQLTSCPEPHRQKLLDYKAFHNATRNAPGAQYLIHSCWGSCEPGTGEAIRNMLVMLRLAMAYNKVFLLDWTQPAPLTHFLVPNEIDWTFTGLSADARNIPHTRLTTDDYNEAFIKGNPDAITRFRSAQKQYYMTMQVLGRNQTEAFIPVTEHHEDHGEIGACYFNFLFKLNSTIVEAGDSHIRQLYGQTSEGFIAWQWRFLGSDDTPVAPFYVSALGATFNCAETVARSLGMDIRKRPMVLVTDSMIFRNVVGIGAFTDVVIPNITTKHIARSREHMQKLHDDFVELYLAAHARCILVNSSSVTTTLIPIWLRGYQPPPCRRDMVTCATIP